MNICLTHPEFGYYNRTDVFGRKGDFVTSPEISQMFGECVALWLYTQWIKNESCFDITELGPGRGTLMADILRTFSQLQKGAMLSKLQNINLVDISDSLKEIQQKSLASYSHKLQFHLGIDDLKLDKEKLNIIVANEFFDALPVHRFQKTIDGWREVLIDLDGENSFRHVLAKSLTKANIICQPEKYKGDLNEIECSPQSWIALEKIFRKSGPNSILFICDYGKRTASFESLRAIKNHKFVDIFHCPGECDLSADVDFQKLKEFIPSSFLIEGPMDQGKFLMDCNIQLRATQLSASNPKALQEAHRLVNEMGQIYQVLLVSPLIK